MEPTKQSALFLKVLFRLLPLHSAFSMFSAHDCCGTAIPGPGNDHMCVNEVTVLPGSVLTSHILISYCHLTHGEFPCYH